MSATTVPVETRLYIGGTHVEGHGAPLPVHDPAREDEIAIVRQATQAQLDEAVASARAAFAEPKWSDHSFRAAVMNRFADLLEAHAQALGDMLVREVGTPVNLVAPLQVGVPIRLFRYYAGLAARDQTQYLGSDNVAGQPSESIVRHVPIGVVAAITAYNYPLLLFALKIAPAMASGCTAVVMTSQQTPLSTLMLASLLREAGVPDGAVNILVGDAALAKALTQHRGIDKVTFTGSVRIGSAVMQQAALSIKPVTLELGGKSALIVLPDCDIETQQPAFHLRYLRNAGQGCASPTRLLVPYDKLERFLELSRAYYQTIKVGDPRDAETVVGPLISAAHRDRVEGYVARALAAGAVIAAGGGRPNAPSGWYMNPVLLSNVDNSFEIAREELFGPVAVVIPYGTVDEAVAIANDSDLGLAGFVFGPHEQAIDVAKRLRTGSVYVNGGGQIRMEAPMGGFKQSGIGREYGEDGLKEYLLAQHIQWPVPA